MRASAGMHRLTRAGGVRSRLHIVYVEDQLDAGWKVLADIEACGALTVIPVVAKPVRSVPRTVWHTLAAPLLLTAHELLAVNDTVRATGALAQIRPTRLHQSHSYSLHKTLRCATPSHSGSPAEGRPDQGG